LNSFRLRASRFGGQAAWRKTCQRELRQPDSLLMWLSDSSSPHRFQPEGRFQLGPLIVK